MRYKVIYENNRGQRVNLSERPYFLNIEPILDYQWSYSEKEKRRGNIIAGFAKDIQSVDLTLHIMDANAEARDEAVDYFNNVIEADIYDGIAGRLIIGDWYTWGYIIASKNTKWQYGKPVVKKVVKLVREQENWYHVVQKANYGSEQAEELYNFVEEDIKTYEGADTNSLKSLTATINPKQDLHGYDKPWVGGAGKNKSPLGSVTTSQYGVFNEGNAKIYENIVQGTTYTLSFDIVHATIENPTVNNRMGVYINNQNPAIIRPDVTAMGHQTVTFTAHANGYLNFWCSGSVYDVNTKVIDNVQLEVGSTATDYEPYSNICPISGWDEVKTYVSPTTSTEDGTTYTTDLPETVYGGSLDVVNGVLTVDRAMVDLGTLTWNYNASWGGYPAFYCSVAPAGIKAPSASSTLIGAICSQYAEVKRDYLYSNNVTAFCIPSDGKVSVRDSRYTSASDFKTAMNGVQMVYELATPQTYQLTPKQVTTLLGTNNVWADSGDVSVEYWDDAGRVKTASGSVVTFSKRNAMSGAGYDYPYDYMADAQSQKRIENPNSVPCDFSITIQGYVDRPEVQIGDNVIAFDLEVPYGAFLTVDSSKKTAIMTLANGEQVNVFGARDPDYYLFERIKEGKNTVTWNGSFLWEIRMLEERSEPRWRMD